MVGCLAGLLAGGLVGWMVSLLVYQLDGSYFIKYARPICMYETELEIVN